MKFLEGLIDWWTQQYRKRPEAPTSGGAGASGTWDSVPLDGMPRGIRNHNPGNIREGPNDSTLWIGERATDDDKAFEEFTEAVYGIRALALTLRNYERKYGLCTIEDIIKRWAPPNENDTVAYVDAICKALNRDKRAVINVHDRVTLMDLTRAIIRHENGIQPYPASVLAAGVDMALSA